MGQQITIGGERLGAGKKMKVNLREYDRSTHDLGYIWIASIVGVLQSSIKL